MTVSEKFLLFLTVVWYVSACVRLCRCVCMRARACVCVWMNEWVSTCGCGVYKLERQWRRRNGRSTQSASGFSHAVPRPPPRSRTFADVVSTWVLAKVAEISITKKRVKVYVLWRSIQTVTLYVYVVCMYVCACLCARASVCVCMHYLCTHTNE